ncbi:MAG: alpha/beta hydrolase family protein [Actinomycetes bacterium]
MAVDTVETPVGDARVDVRAAADARVTLVLGHGAGGGIETPDLSTLARRLPADGITVIRVEQPWHVAGRRAAAPPPTLDRAWLAVLDALDLPGPVAVGGRSAGARVACRTATQVGAVGVVALAFPLHPPGRPEKSRLEELLGSGVPTLVVQGERDPFGGPEAFPRKRLRPYVVHAVRGADHSFRVPKGNDQAATLADLAETVRRWVLDRR